MIYLLLLTTSLLTIFTTAREKFPPNFFSSFYMETSSKPHKNSWSYGEGAYEWNKLYPQCGGSNQSPIRLKQIHATNVSMTWLEWGNMDKVPTAMNLTNNGHTVVLEGMWPVGQAPFIYQRHIGRHYELQQTHWHWGYGARDGSEHKIDGRKGALEMHMVFRRAYDQVERGPDKLVIAFIFQMDYDFPPPPGLTAVASNLESVEEPGDRVWLLSPFRAGDLVPQEPTSVFIYSGSLTTPPCSEPVTWLVVAKFGYVGYYEMEAFRSIMDNRGREMSGNVRPLQPRNDRDILMYTADP